MRLWAILLLGVAGTSIATMVPIDTPSSLRLENGKPEWSWQSEDQGPGNKREVSETSELIESNPEPSVNNRIFMHSIPAIIRLIRLQVESVIEEILVSNRQGRNIEGYDQIYSDPDVKNALQLGNDTIARSYIRDKLCSLGLMNVRIKDRLE